MSKTFINGGSVDKITIGNIMDGISVVKLRVTGMNKTKHAEVSIDVQITADDGHKEVLSKQFEISRQKDKCTGFVEFQLPYNVESVKILKGDVKKL